MECIYTHVCTYIIIRKEETATRQRCEDITYRIVDGGKVEVTTHSWLIFSLYSGSFFHRGERKKRK